MSAPAGTVPPEVIPAGIVTFLFTDVEGSTRLWAADAAATADRLAIQEVLAAHSRGLDRCDVSLLQACYWPEGEVDYGSFRGSAHEFAGLVCTILAEQYQLTQQRLAACVARGTRWSARESLWPFKQSDPPLSVAVSSGLDAT